MLEAFFVCSYHIEKQAADFYTREVFSKFQKLLAKSTGYGLQYQLQGLHGVVWFRIVANYGVNPKVYTVRVAPKDQTYMCTCNMFEMCGLICPHIIYVMVHLNVQTIPARYIGDVSVCSLPWPNRPINSP